MSARRFKFARHTGLELVHPSESPYRLHAVGYRPTPLPRPNVVVRYLDAALALRRLFTFHRKSGCTRLVAFGRARRTVVRDLNLNRSPR